MANKTLLITLLSFGLLLSVAHGLCLADASFQIEETAVYKNRYGSKTFSDYYNVAAVSPAGHPVAWWKFEGNAGDSIGNNHGTEYGDPCYAAAVFGQAINLNGKNYYVVVPDNAGSAAIEFGDESFSITLWVRSKWAVGSEKQFIIKNGTSGSEYKDAGGKRYAIKFQTQNFRFVLDDGVTKTMINGSSADFATGVWVLRSFAQCGQDSDCTGECHDGCPPPLCLCEIDASKCVGDCNSCLPFSGVCYDNPAGCPGDCEDCIDGSCVDEDIYCGTGCQTCQNGTCVDNNDECDGCLKCENDECVPDDSKCPGCQKCITSGTTGVCVDDDTKCNAANCETCVNSECKVCGGDLTKKCCPDQSCVKLCELRPEDRCNTSQDYKCIFCAGTVVQCVEIFNARFYTGNTRYYCGEHGCPGDCVRDDDVHCYTEYDCYGVLLQGLCALHPITKTLFCYIQDPTVPDNSCPRCDEDPDDPGEPGMVHNYKCL